MQQQSTIALLVVILTISSCIEFSVAQESNGRIAEIGVLIPTANSSFGGSPGTAFLLTDTRLHDGVMFAISAYYRSHKPVRFQVWRPTNQSLMYKLVWEYNYTAPVIGVRQNIYFNAWNKTMCYHFRHNDRVGVLFDEVPGAIPRAFHTDGRIEIGYPPIHLHDEVKFDTLGYPYKFSVKAFIDTVNDLYVNDTREWVPCPKTTIPDDSPLQGATGFTGPAGPVGSTGPKGDRGLPGLSGNVSHMSSHTSDTDGSTLMNMIALIWLAVLTLAVIIIVLLYCLVERRRQNSKGDSENRPGSHHPSVYGNRSRTPSSRDDVWFSDLKEETESTYSVHTMKETTPLSKTGPFVFEGPFESSQVENNGHHPTDPVATLDVSSPTAQY